jgi:prepilin-type N-terminal cleavage/methylation domain-containing protein
VDISDAEESRDGDFRKLAQKKRSFGSQAVDTGRMLRPDSLSSYLSPTSTPMPRSPQHYFMRQSRAFTLIELLVVIVIIALLAVMVVTVAGPFQRKAQMTQAVAAMRQLSSGLLVYTGSHDGELPGLGTESPEWGQAKDEEAKNAWYNSVPVLAGGRALSSFELRNEFYNKSNVLFIPAAKYPAVKAARPYFAVALNEKLYPKRSGGDASDGNANSGVRVQNMVQASRTVVFFENGLPDEKPLPGQNEYKGNASGWVRTMAARYGNTDAKTTEDALAALTNIVCGDGHVETLAANAVMDPKGGAYFPQLEQNNTRGGKVSWTLDPDTNPNN